MSGELDLNPIRERCGNATGGPWERFVFTNEESYDGIEATAFPRSVVLGGIESGVVEAADAEFIAHAREDVPALIAEVERLREAILFCSGSCGHMYRAALERES